MNTSLKLLFAKFLVGSVFAVTSLFSVTAVQAVPTTYDYTGNTFNFTIGSYTTSDFVTAMVTLANPLPANMAPTVVTPTAFSLSDGVQTITNLTALSSFFKFATGPTGQITEWGIEVKISDERISTNNQPNTETIDTGSSSSGFGEIIGNPGVWTRAAAPDAGSSFALLSLSLTALGVAARQFKRAAA